MSEMEQAMNSVWLPSGRKFHLPKLEKLTLKNVHFVKSNTEARFFLDSLAEVSIGPYIFRQNQNFHTNITHMLSVLLSRPLSKVDLIFDIKDDWLLQKQFLDEIKSGLDKNISLSKCEKIKRENLVFLMLYMGNEIMYSSIDFTGLELIEDEKVIWKVPEAKFDRDSEELDDFMRKLHTL